MSADAVSNELSQCDNLLLSICVHRKWKNRT